MQIQQWDDQSDGFQAAGGGNRWVKKAQTIPWLEIENRYADILRPSVPDAFPQKPRMYRQVARRNYPAYARKRSHTAKETRNCVRVSLQYLRRDLEYPGQFADHGARLLLPGDTLYGKLLVIQELHRQQREMYRGKSSRIEDRIVGIDQPRVRPIVRGKAGCPAELGAKITVGLAGGYALLEDAD